MEPPTIVQLRKTSQNVTLKTVNKRGAVIHFELHSSSKISAFDLYSREKRFSSRIPQLALRTEPGTMARHAAQDITITTQVLYEYWRR